MKCKGCAKRRKALKKFGRKIVKRFKSKGTKK